MARALYALSHGIKAVNPANHLYGLPKLPEGLKTQFYFWAIDDAANGIILVDQGCTNKCLETMGIPQCLTAAPLDLLAQIGIKPEDVRHVILSHLHWDHYAGDDFFPNATYWLHQKEFDHVNSDLMRYDVYAQHYYRPALDKIKKLQAEGRLRLLKNEEEEIFPGIACIRTGGHTPGLLSVAVKGGDDEKIICGDVLPRYLNLEKSIPCGIHYDVTESLQAQETIARRAQNIGNVLPGHDPGLTEHYPEIKPGVWRIF